MRYVVSLLNEIMEQAFVHRILAQEFAGNAIRAVDFVVGLEIFWFFARSLSILKTLRTEVEGCFP